MDTKFKTDFEALLNRLLHETDIEELARMVEDAECGVYQHAKDPIVPTGAHATVVSFSNAVSGAIFPFFPQSTSFVKLDALAANYEDLALAA